jgi:hypothetical protein
MKRIEFFKNLALGVGGLLILPGCDNPSSTKDKDTSTPPEADIVLSNADNEVALANTINKSSPVIKTAATDKKSFTIKVGATVLTVVPEKTRIKITKSSSSESVFIRLGSKNLQPSVILERPDGTQISEEAFVPPTGSPLKPADWLAQAVLVLAGALAIWLGATIVKFVAAAIAFIAMNILLLSIILAAAATLAWILEKTGWDWHGLVEIIENGVDWIKDLLRDIIVALP